MIGSLSGRLAEKEPAEILVETGGVGYRIAVPLTTYGRLPAVGATVHLSIHTHVREDSLGLFGFDSRRERDLFEKLISVPGVGPRLALAILSHMEPEALLEAVGARDAARLTRVPGIGPKTAERLLLELGGVLKDLPAEGTVRPAAGRGPGTDLVAALVNLGYRPAQAGPVVEAVLRESVEGAPVADLLRESLRRLGTPPAGPARRPAPAGREA